MQLTQHDTVWLIRVGATIAIVGAPVIVHELGSIELERLYDRFPGCRSKTGEVHRHTDTHTDADTHNIDTQTHTRFFTTTVAYGILFDATVAHT